MSIRLGRGNYCNTKLVTKSAVDFSKLLHITQNWPILRLERGKISQSLFTEAMASQLSRKRVVVEAPTIPDRLYFKIGDVARICGVETYVLRFWETQFPQLRPGKSGTGQRLYRRRDVEMALEIKRLVHDQGYTLAGARQTLEQGHRRRGSLASADAATEPVRKHEAAETIARARAELREIAAMLAAPLPRVPRRRERIAAISSSSDSLFPA